jgi:ankyrin repeat protein
MRVLIRHGADVNAKGQNDGTALMSAVAYNDVEAVKLLLRAGAKVNAKTAMDNTALDMVETGRGAKEAAIIEALLKKAGAKSYIWSAK